MNARTRRTIDFNNPPRFLTVLEAADLAGVSDQQIRSLLIRGVIRGCKVGAVWRVNTHAFFEFLGLGDDAA